MSIEQAAAELDGLSSSILDATVPPSPYYSVDDVARYRALRLTALPGATGFSTLRERYATPLLFVFSLAALVLLLACTNLTSLLLARLAERGREIAIRMALGA